MSAPMLAAVLWSSEYERLADFMGMGIVKGVGTRMFPSVVCMRRLAERVSIVGTGGSAGSGRLGGGRTGADAGMVCFRGRRGLCAGNIATTASA